MSGLIQQDTAITEYFEKECILNITDTEPLVSIITPAYNNIKFSEKYFESVNNQTYKNIEVIYSDQSAKDGTYVDAVPKLQCGKILKVNVDEGCAAGNNRCVGQASGKFVFLLGPDTKMEPDCVENLVKIALTDENKVYAPRQMSYDGSVFLSCGIAADIFGYPARTYTKDGKKQLKKIFYADGTGVFMTRENYIKIGMMDEGTYLYTEDVDLSWKANLLGLTVVPVSNSVIYHWSGGSIGGMGDFIKDLSGYETKVGRRFMVERNIIRNIIKNYSWWNVPWVLALYMSINFFEFLALIMTGQFESAVKSYISAYIWDIKNIRSTLKKRQQIQSIRKVGDWEMLKRMYFVPSKFLALLELGVPRVRLK